MSFGSSNRECRRRCRRRAAIAQVGGDEVLSGGDVQGAKADTAEGGQGDLEERQADYSVHPAVGVWRRSSPEPKAANQIQPRRRG
jgi:hypothetical protein